MTEWFSASAYAPALVFPPHEVWWVNSGLSTRTRGPPTSSSQWLELMIAGSRDTTSFNGLIPGRLPSPNSEAFAARLPAASKRWLSIAGPLPGAEIPDFYDAIDVFAMPSRTDSFGIVFLEAWANAKPVVAAASGGVTEVVEQDKTGLLVPFGNQGMLAEAMDRLLADRVLERGVWVMPA